MGKIWRLKRKNKAAKINWKILANAAVLQQNVKTTTLHNLLNKWATVASKRRHKHKYINLSEWHH